MYGELNPMVYNDWFSCLFPEQRTTEVPKHELQQELFRRLDEYQPDMVITGPIVFPCGAITLRWAHRNRRHIMVFDDYMVGNGLAERIKLMVKRLLYSRVDAYLVPNPKYLGTAKAFGFERPRVVYGLSAIDTMFYSSGKPAPDGTGEYIHWPMVKRKVLLTVGRLVPIKNHGKLLEAWESVMRDHPGNEWELKIVGDGYLRHQLEDMIRSRSIPHVRLLGGLDGQEVRDLYATSDAFILPSLSESWGMVVSEAMASGLPVLVSRTCNCVTDLVDDGVNGKLFEPTDVNDIARAIKGLMKSESRSKMGVESKNRVRKYDVAILSSNIREKVVDLKDAAVRKAMPMFNIALNLWGGRMNLRSFDK